ncbi:MAG TPA: acyl-CoA dehydrogenase family protein [Conexibacter sp.]|nr:acyl-CoA dehydrogenase family protein [Conexibacter sp.]
MEFRIDAKTARWRQVARDFANEVVRPIAAELDAQRNPADAWSWALVEEADRRGLRQAPAPAEYGGDDTSYLANTVMLEEIAAADVGSSVVIAQHWKYIHMIREIATPDQQRRWLTRIAENPRAVMAAAFTEPGAGSDNFLPYDAPGAGMQTRAERRDGGYVLNGMKHFISNGNRADVVLTFARTDPDGPLTSSVSLFLVGADNPGFSTGRVHDKTGERLANNAELLYRDAFVAEEDRLGEEGAAMVDVARLLRGSNTYAGACALGVARECYDRTMAFCRERVQGGKPIVEHENVGAYLADMYLNVDVARTYLWRAAWQAGSADTFEGKLGITPKLVVSERTFDSARKMMEVWGGRGVMKENGIEKLLRDAAIWLHSDGTNIVMRMKLMNNLRACGPGPELWDAVPTEAPAQMV